MTWDYCTVLVLHCRYAFIHPSAGLEPEGRFGREKAVLVELKSSVGPTIQSDRQPTIDFEAPHANPWHSYIEPCCRNCIPLSNLHTEFVGLYSIVVMSQLLKNSGSNGEQG
jgi:hypothetical protein